MHNALRIFVWLHWLGLAMLALGLWWLWRSPAESVAQMTLYAGLIGLGLLLMGPYPVVKFVQWAKRQSDAA